MAAHLSALGMGPRKGYTGKLARHGQLACRNGVYVADSDVVYATQVIEMFTIMPNSIITNLLLWDPDGWGTGVAIDVGTVDSAGSFTALADASAADAIVTAATTQKLAEITLTPATDLPSRTAETIFGIRLGGTITVQPTGGERIILLAQYQTIQFD